MPSALASVRVDPDLVSIETLDEEIVSLTAKMTIAEYELLVLIRAFDERGGWLKWGRRAVPSGSTGAATCPSPLPGKKSGSRTR